MSNVVIDIAAEFTGKKAFKQADTATDKLSKGAKKLAGAFGLALGGQAILAFGKASIKAAAADEKAQKQLALALKNVGLGRDAATSEAFIQRLQSEFGILDDKLRPAYQTLAVATRDSAEAQRLLNLALDISASTGKDLGSVTSALSKAFLGNNTALSKLGVGISKADLKAGKFDDIISKLEITFAGSATASANTFQGSIDKLGVASANVQEIIGTGLIDALKGLSDADSVDNLAVQMQGVATYVADTIRGIGVMIGYLKTAGETISKIPGLNLIMDAVIFSNPALQAIKAINKLGADAAARAAANGVTAQSLAHMSELTAKYTVKTLDGKKKLTAEELKALAAAQKALAAKKLAAAIDKANLLLGKGEDVFDIEKIQNAAALTNQAELLGKATSAAQILQIANDTARLNVKRSILALEEAIAANDEAAIIAATKKLNADLGVLNALTGQNTQMKAIETILKGLDPKSLIDLQNLKDALALLELINIASTGSKTKPAGIATTAPSTAGLVPATTIAETNANVAALGGVITQIQPNLREFTPDTGMLSGISPSGREFNFTVNVNTGIGDPNAIAEAVTQVIQDAVDRGTLRGGAY
jgi:hypothetical protein